MSDRNIDKDIEKIKTRMEYYKNNPEGCNWRLSFEGTEDIQAIENVLSELEIKDKMIDKMAEYLADMDFDKCCEKIPEPCLGCSWEDYEPHTNCIKEHFRNEVLKDE